MPFDTASDMSPPAAEAPAIRPGLAGRFTAAFRRWRAARQAARELEELDDRTLSDMGISRCEIPRLLLPPGPDWK